MIPDYCQRGSSEDCLLALAILCVIDIILRVFVEVGPAIVNTTPKDPIIKSPAHPSQLFAQTFWWNVV